jgi:hypothetical protein
MSQKIQLQLSMTLPDLLYFTLRTFFQQMPGTKYNSNDYGYLIIQQGKESIIKNYILYLITIVFITALLVNLSNKNKLTFTALLL